MYLSLFLLWQNSSQKQPKEASFIFALWYQSIWWAWLVRHEKVLPGYGNAILCSGSSHAVQTRNQSARLRTEPAHNIKWPALVIYLYQAGAASPRLQNSSKMPPTIDKCSNVKVYMMSTLYLYPANMIAYA